jgi:hypothetical protein
LRLYWPDGLAPTLPSAIWRVSLVFHLPFDQSPLHGALSAAWRKTLPFALGIPVTVAVSVTTTFADAPLSAGRSADS